MTDSTTTQISTPAPSLVTSLPSSDFTPGLDTKQVLIRSARDLLTVGDDNSVNVAWQLLDMIRQRTPGSAALAATPTGIAPVRAARRQHRAPSTTVSLALPKGVKRSKELLARIRETVLDHVAKNPNVGVEAIGKALGLRTKDMMLPIRQLLAEGSLGAVGEKRATRYSATGTRSADSQLVSSLAELSMLVGAPSEPQASSPKRASKSGRAIGEKRPQEEIAKMMDKLLAFISDNPGRRIEEINKALGTSLVDVVLPIRKLRANKQIVVKGEKRAMTYFPKPVRTAPSKPAKAKKAKPAKAKAKAPAKAKKAAPKAKPSKPRVRKPKTPKTETAPATTTSEASA